MSSRPAPPRAVFDTNVIFSRVLHELLGRLGSRARLFDLVWSDELIAEAIRVLVERKPMDEPVARRWVSHLTAAFPNGRVQLSDLPDGITLSSLTSDPGDEHVCALATRTQRGGPAMDLMMLVAGLTILLATRHNSTALRFRRSATVDQS